MLPTIQLDNRIVVNKAAYGLHVPFTNTYVARFAGPQVGDVVVLDSPEEDKVLLKRVVGTPGTRVEVRGGPIWLDDKLAPVEQRPDGLYEQLGGALHQVPVTRNGGPDYGPVTIPEGRYLVMGDNRGDSHDGRSVEGSCRATQSSGAPAACSGAAGRPGTACSRSADRDGQLDLRRLNLAGLVGAHAQLERSRQLRGAGRRRRT